MSDAVQISQMPACDLCGDTAEYDARLRGRTTWAYLCPAHFASHAAGLGEGHGQRLVPRGEEVPAGWDVSELVTPPGRNAQDG